MPARKTTTSSTKKSATKSKTSSVAAAIRGGALPPYGVPIREAIARGNPQEMKAVAASARKHLSNVQSALDALEKTLTTKR
jgi:hypothetical protein